MKRSIKPAGLLLRAAVLATVLALLACAALAEGTREGIHAIRYGEEPEGLIGIHTELQEQYLNDKPSKAASYADGTAENSWPEGLQISWPGLSGMTRLFLAEDASFAGALEYDVEGLQETVVYNLKLDTVYYWKLSGPDGEGEVSSFRTAPSLVRTLRVEGVTNVRDIGGYATAGGGRVRQGMLYRSAKLNEDSTDEVTLLIASDGIRAMREELGIRTEIDLRTADDGENGGLTASALGEDVQYFLVPMKYSTARDAKGDPLNDNAASICLLFSILADEANYPMVFHCSVGTDRTGMVAYLISGLLGVDDNGLMTDYLFSDFGDIGYARQAAGLSRSVYLSHIKKCEGETLPEKIRNCLLELGVPREELDAVVAIMTE